jgi:transposase
MVRIMKRINMRKIKEVLRLKSELNLSNEKISYIVEVGETTVREYLIRAKNAKITWPLPDGICDKTLEEALYPAVFDDHNQYELPDFEGMHKELSKKGITRLLLWKEYKTANPNHYCYSKYCRLYEEWLSSSDTWMMQTHKAGGETFIDWAGLTMPIWKKDGSVDFEAQIFVSALGFSSYTFCTAVRSQQTFESAKAHKRMCEFYDGVTEYWIPDNYKAAVTKSDRYEPICQKNYDAMARHYHVAIVPARVRSPQDKSKVESAVYLVETHILAPLRNRQFFSLEELNDAIKGPLEALNKEPFQKMPGSSRYSLYLEVDKSALTPLPKIPYEVFCYGSGILNKGYHIFIEGIPYSVPFKFVGRIIESRHNERTVEFFYNGQQIAIHQRSFQAGIPVTDPNHQPIKHRLHVESTNPENIKEQARKMGESVLAWVVHVLEDPDVKERQRINRALGVVRLAKTYAFVRINAACARGLFYGNFHFKGIEDILKRNLDAQPLPIRDTQKLLPQNHINVRGPNYYL